LTAYYRHIIFLISSWQVHRGFSTHDDESREEARRMTSAPLDGQPLAALFDAAARRDGPLALGQPLWGFGGVQGGLALGLLTEAMRARAQGRGLRYVSARYRQPLREHVEIAVVDDGAGKSVSWLSARASEQGATCVEASAAFVGTGKSRLTSVSPPKPHAPAPDECPVFKIPLDFVPFARRTEVRFVGDALPYTGGSTPELMAWIRFVEDDLPPTDSRLVILMDCLPPSFAAVLHSLSPIPTVMFTVTPGNGLSQATSPWILLRAHTGSSSRDGWLMERLDAWSPEGAHLGSAEQVRIVMGR
jgi:hypothetical protein